MPMQYTVILNVCKNGNLRTKFFDFFLTFAQNIDRGYTAVLTSTHNLCFSAKKKMMYTPVNPNFTI